MTNRTIVAFLGVIGLAFGTVVCLNWDTVSKNLIEALDRQSHKTEATLFRWGELMSISAELKDRFGAEPEVTYDTSTSDRTLNIRFTNYLLPEQVTTRGHAREIAAFAIGKTTKFKQIDAVTVLFPDGSGSHRFSLDDLMPRQP